MHEKNQHNGSYKIIEKRQERPQHVEKFKITEFRADVNQTHKEQNGTDGPAIDVGDEDPRSGDDAIDCVNETRRVDAHVQKNES